MSEIRGTESRGLTVRTGQMVFDIPSEEAGVDEIVYAADIHGADSGGPINLGGAWQGLVDEVAMLDALDKIRRGYTFQPCP